MWACAPTATKPCHGAGGARPRAGVGRLARRLGRADSDAACTPRCAESAPSSAPQPPPPTLPGRGGSAAASLSLSLPRRLTLIPRAHWHRITGRPLALIMIMTPAMIMTRCSPGRRGPGRPPGPRRFRLRLCSRFVVCEAFPSSLFFLISETTEPLWLRVSCARDTPARRRRPGRPGPAA